MIEELRRDAAALTCWRGEVRARLEAAVDAAVDVRQALFELLLLDAQLLLPLALLLPAVHARLRVLMATLRSDTSKRSRGGGFHRFGGARRR
jgi:hypothetical protein